MNMAKIDTQYEQVNDQLTRIIQKAAAMERRYQNELAHVHPIYQKSAANLLHYLALRSFDIDGLQLQLRDLGLPGFVTCEGYVMRHLINLKNILSQLQGHGNGLSRKGFISRKKSEKLLRKNTQLLFGYKSKKRNTRIMVTLPNTAAGDLEFVKRLLSLGMNCARINCAHDDAETWKKMIDNIKAANAQLQKRCKITMDLGGPKLRTGSMLPGPKVVHIRPMRDDLGRVTNPAQIWIAPPDVPPPAKAENAVHIPVDALLFQKIKRGNTIYFTDSRNKKCSIIIDRQEGDGKWGLCTDSAYLETGTELVLHKEKQTGEAVDRVGELLPKEQFITLFQGDTLILHKDPRPGEPAVLDAAGRVVTPAHISCTLPEIFDDVRQGEPVYFDDGKIEGVIATVSPEALTIKILHARDNGSKLKADKGINLPESTLRISGLTAKDREDLAFVAHRADAINYSFVNTVQDVEDLQAVLEEQQAKPGIILKIETQRGFANLPAILLAAMRNYPTGVMIARGDLAIETGWKNFASIQQEIVRICAAAHIPNVWATQVLESLAKKGTPSRAEITDAALAAQAECVMLNKGYYIHKAVKMLDKILRRMQRFQRKTVAMLPRLEQADQLVLSHKAFDVV
ncbi:MAG: hypothetical protein H6574_19905 [Lewinellaceae bacterium]|nr:hypothetical protein [Lewinellaceae bacterium]